MSQQCPRDTDGDGNCGQRFCPLCFPTRTPAEIAAAYDMRQDQIRALTPTTIGTTRDFIAHGKKFVVKKSNRNTWSLRKSGDNGYGVDRNTRVRFGTLEQIQEDISYVLDIGDMPPRKGHAP